MIRENSCIIGLIRIKKLVIKKDGDPDVKGHCLLLIIN